MIKKNSFYLSILATLTIYSNSYASDFTPPVSPQKPVVETLHGVTLTDSYKWLEDKENLEVKEVPALIPLRALDFMEKHRLKPRDAFHVALMEHFGEREIVSDDTDFDRVPGIKRIKI